MIQVTSKAVVDTHENPAKLVAIAGIFMAFSTEGSDVIQIQSTRKLSAEPLRIKVHSDRFRFNESCAVQAIHIAILPKSQRTEVLLEKQLYAATRHCIYSWDIADCYANLGSDLSLHSNRIELPSECYVSQLGNDKNMKWIAAICDSEILIINRVESKLRMRLQGHLSQINAFQFDDHIDDRLFTVSDDRTFKVWDLQREELLYQSSIYGANPLICVAIDPTFPRLAVGSTDGLIRFFDYSSPGCQLIQCLDVNAAVKKQFGEPENQDDADDDHVALVNGYTSSRNNASKRGWDEDVVGLECPSSLSSIYYMKIGQNTSPSGIFPDAPKLIACTSQMIIIVDAYTYELLQVITYSNISYQNGLRLNIETPYLFAADCRSTACINLCITSAFTPHVHLVDIEYRIKSEIEIISNSEVDAIDSMNDSDSDLSVFPAAPLQKLSSLYSAADKQNNTMPLVTSYEKNAHTKASRSKNKGASNNKPVTFHSKIKSSGYGKIEPLKFLGKTVSSRTPKSRSSSSKSARLLKSYPMDCGLINKLQKQNILENDQEVHVAPILRARFCPDGSRIATASVDKSARVLKLPFSKYKGDGESFLGHTAPVLSSCWSHSGDYILTASSDRSACLWNIRKSHPLLQIFDADSSGTGKKGTSFKSDVKAAKFFQLDKMIVLACMNKLHFYKYDIGPKKPIDDITRLHQPNTYTHILEIPSKAQNISDFDCQNGFISHLIVSGTSAKNIEIFDANASALVRCFPNAHSRSIHAIVMNSTSPYSSHDKSAHELFLSASTDSTIKLWDIRSPRSIRCFSGHQNRQNPIGISFSPCMRFIASGSEDKVAYVFDLRMGTIMSKIRQGIHDVVGDVAFHPVYPQLVAATYDGKLRFYSS